MAGKLLFRVLTPQGERCSLECGAVDLWVKDDAQGNGGGSLGIRRLDLRRRLHGCSLCGGDVCRRLGKGLLCGLGQGRREDYCCYDRCHVSTP